ncbi:hypothetical protein, conserved [Babesia ovata]|uniref:6-Cys domain-containing protein n=1 Tax=Babesia ovata TaxID=189622 RepID=A0A2H6KCR5_9APIC|nr:uncharacterized protein BOVATA_022700 [Babesia ovata]GBE60777.1 hypothetical protein, conserved [Babesia ovata]
MMWLSVLGALALTCICAVERAFARMPAERPPAPVRTFTGKSNMREYKVSVERVTLDQPHEVNFLCGQNDAAHFGGEFTLYPSDPMTKTLLPLEGDDLEDAISKEVLLRNISRSTMLRIQTSNHRGPGSFVKVMYPVNALIMAKDPQNFSLNYACKYQPRDKRQPPFYRWLEVKFKYVYPMAYGCASGNDMLFKNSVFREDNYMNRAKSSYCAISAEPNLLFGIYCKPGERLSPEDCVPEIKLYRMQGLLVRYELNDQDAAAIPGYDVPSRLKLFKISPAAMDKEFYVNCRCIGADGYGKQLYLNNHVNVEMNPLATLTARKEGFQTSFEVMNVLRPGKRFEITVPRNGWGNLGYLGRVKSYLHPEDPKQYVQVGIRTQDYPERMYKFIGAKNLSITQQDNPGKRTYTINYRKDAVVVLKSSIPFMHYRWEANGSHGPQPVKVSFKMDVPLMPTDPYTYGCGVDSLHLFHYEGFELHQGDNADEVACRLNPHVVSPVGFYCPKGFKLEPADCFREMLHKESGRVVQLADYAPHARPLDGTYIRVLDFHVPQRMSHLVRYSNDELSCRCLDAQGNVRASITLDLRKPTVEEKAPDTSALSSLPAK